MGMPQQQDERFRSDRDFVFPGRRTVLTLQEDPGDVEYPIGHRPKSCLPAGASLSCPIHRAAERQPVDLAKRRLALAGSHICVFAP
jgi:hypothetical protein